MIKKIEINTIIILTIINIILSIYINLLPSTHLLIILLIYLIIDLLTIFLLKKNNKITTIIGTFLSIIIIILSIGITLILIRTQIFLNNIATTTDETQNYSIIVLKKSNYKKINNINNKNLGILKSTNKNYQQSLNKLKTKINTNNKKYQNEYYLAKSLINKEVDAILLNETYISILDEGIKDFENNIKIIYNFEIKSKKEYNNINTNTNLDNNKSFNIYISGIDTYGEISSVSRSDVNIIATINLQTGNILLTNIPRDMYVHLNGTIGLNDKLTHAGIYGINTSVKTLEEFLDTNINYYIRINFSSLIKIVDTIGGIDVYSDYDFKAGNRYYKKGINYNLNGKEALAFSRNRYSFYDGDRQRGRNQEKVIASIINKTTTTYNPNTYIELLQTIEDSFQTNMSRTTINKLINLQIKNNYQWNIQFNDINGYDSSNYTYSYPWQKLYVMEVDNNSLNNAKKMINTTLKTT